MLPSVPPTRADLPHGIAARRTPTRLSPDAGRLCTGREGHTRHPLLAPDQNTVEAKRDALLAVRGNGCAVRQASFASRPVVKADGASLQVDPGTKLAELLDFALVGKPRRPNLPGAGVLATRLTESFNLLVASTVKLLEVESVWPKQARLLIVDPDMVQRGERDQIKLALRAKGTSGLRLQ